MCLCWLSATDSADHGCALRVGDLCVQTVVLVAEHSPSASWQQYTAASGYFGHVRGPFLSSGKTVLKHLMY